ncbi:MAG: ABC transporter substrate-binding protein, partial [Shewanella sp.]|nr:ABC transporter substrate-binding protein [Shewanella sp.]
DPDHLKMIVEQELLPYIDYKYASYKVLGKYLSKTTKAQRDSFTQAFRGYLVSTYASAFTAYTHQKVSFSPAGNFAEEKFVTVAVQVIEAGRPPIKLSFKVRRLMTGERKDRKPRTGDHWKAIDLVAEGISLLQSKQSEIGNLVQKEGIEEVVKMLDKRANASIETKKASSK